MRTEEINDPGTLRAGVAVGVAETEQVSLCRQPDYSRKRHDDALHVMG